MIRNENEKLRMQNKRYFNGKRDVLFSNSFPLFLCAKYFKMRKRSFPTLHLCLLAPLREKVKGKTDVFWKMPFPVLLF